MARRKGRGAGRPPAAVRVCNDGGRSASPLDRHTRYKEGGRATLRHKPRAPRCERRLACDTRGDARLHGRQGHPEVAARHATECTEARLPLGNTRQRVAGRKHEGRKPCNGRGAATMKCAAKRRGGTSARRSPRRAARRRPHTSPRTQPKSRAGAIPGGEGAAEAWAKPQCETDARATPESAPLAEMQRHRECCHNERDMQRGANSRAMTSRSWFRAERESW